MRTTLHTILCATLFTSFTATSLATTLTGPIINPANGHAYYLLDAASWTESESEAITMGGNLVTIKDQAENDWVFRSFSSLVPLVFSSSSIWVGLNNVSKEGEFAWASGEIESFVNWHSNRPDNWQGVEDYVQMLVPQSTTDDSLWGMWNDTTDEAGDIESSHAVVEIVPLPPVVWLFATGLIAVIGLARRGNRKYKP